MVALFAMVATVIVVGAEPAAANNAVWLPTDGSLDVTFDEFDPPLGNREVSSYIYSSSSETVDVTWHTEETGTGPGHATQGVDYAYKSFTTRIFGGEIAKWIYFDLYADTVAEGDETFALVIDSVTGGTAITDGYAVVTIRDDDEDHTAPDTTLVSWPPNPTTSSSATFEFTANEPSTFECRLDTDPWLGCSSPRDYTGLGTGGHTFQVKATDLAGNPDPSPASYAWTITTGDVTDPTVDLRTPPAGAVYRLDQMVVADFSCDDEVGGSGIASCVGTVEDGSPIATAALGSHPFTVTATDGAGNSNQVTHDYTVTDAVATDATYHLDEGSGTVLVDSSGNGHDGTVTDGVWVGNAPHGQALDFSTAVTWAHFPGVFPFHDPQAGGTDEATFSFLLKPVDNQHRTLLWTREGPATPDTNRFHIYYGWFNDPPEGFGSFGMDYRSPDGDHVVMFDQPIPLNVWSHVVVTRTLDEGAGQYTYTLYLDGAPVATYVQATGGLPTAPTWSIGRMDGGLVDYAFNGGLDEIRLWTRALGAAEVAGLYGHEPVVDLRTPADGAVYDRHQDVTVDFSCAAGPDGLGIDSCVGTVDDGAALPTEQLGEHEFTVTATDLNGATTEVTHTYTVAYPPHGYPDVPDWAFYDEALDWAKAEGIVVAAFPDGGFHPNDPINRGQITNILWTMMDQPPGSPPHGFVPPDVPADAWYEDGLDWAKAEGLITGYHRTIDCAPQPTPCYRPKDPVRRGQIVNMSWNMVDRPDGYPLFGYTDIPLLAPYRDAMRWADALDLINTFVGDTKAQPRRAATRGEVVYILYRVASTEAAWAAFAGDPPSTVLF